MEKNTGHQVKSSSFKEKSFLFALRIVKLYKYLTDKKREFVLSKQVLKSGTNPGAMAREADNAESGFDFVHKLGIAQKEIGETQYWLELLHAADYISKKEFESLNDDANELMRMVRSSILTKKKNLKSDKR